MILNGTFLREAEFHRFGQYVCPSVNVSTNRCRVTSHESSQSVTRHKIFKNWHVEGFLMLVDGTNETVENTSSADQSLQETTSLLASKSHHREDAARGVHAP